jgi:hypothetical protein
MSQRISLPSQFADDPFTFGSARAAGVGEVASAVPTWRARFTGFAIQTAARSTSNTSVTLSPPECLRVVSSTP